VAIGQTVIKISQFFSIFKWALKMKLLTASGLERYSVHHRAKFHSVKPLLRARFFDFQDGGRPPFCILKILNF